MLMRFMHVCVCVCTRGNDLECRVHTATDCTSLVLVPTPSLTPRGCVPSCVNIFTHPACVHASRDTHAPAVRACVRVFVQGRVDDAVDTRLQLRVACTECWHVSCAGGLGPGDTCLCPRSSLLFSLMIESDWFLQGYFP